MNHYQINKNELERREKDNKNKKRGEAKRDDIVVRFLSIQFPVKEIFSKKILLAEIRIKAKKMYIDFSFL